MTMAANEGAGTADQTEAVAPQVIDLTPTWAAVLPIFLTALEYGTAEGQKSAKLELMRMAHLADMQVQASNTAPPPAEPADTPLTIDITPTWQGMLGALIALMENGEDAGRSEAQRELARMARVADMRVAAKKAGNAH